MTEVTAAMSAGDFCSSHAQCLVNDGRYVSFSCFFPKTRPACSRIKLRIRRKKVLTTIRTNVHAGFVMIVILATKRRLGAFQEADVVLLGSEVGVDGVGHRLLFGSTAMSPAG